MDNIVFGTDGWRAVIADDFTFDNVRAVTQATAEYLLKQSDDPQGVVVGYDTRFLSATFARAAAEVLAANKIPVALTTSVVPTPVLSHAVRQRGASAGVMITASHNPARWNGFKLRGHDGSAAPIDISSAVELAIPSILEDRRVKQISLQDAEKSGTVERLDPRPDYLASIRRLVDIDAIRNAGLNVLVDSMYGAAAGWTSEAISEGPTHVRELHSERNPAFPGLRAPEPIASNLGEFLGLLSQGGYDIGLATDGDGDRVGLADENGVFITQLQTFALIAYYLLHIRGERGPIIRSITTTRMIDKLGEHFGCPVYETKVGFKHLAEKMLETDALIAGEESGGYGFRGHIPERDGVLSGLFLLDYIAKTKRRPSELLTDLYDLVGTHEYDRVDITLRDHEREQIIERVASAEPKRIAGLRTESRDTIDGFRFTMEGGWWLLLRFSGTEPLLRIYAEMPSTDHVQEALQAGQEMVGITL